MNCQPNMLRLFISTKRKKVANMLISSALEGKFVRSSQGEGIIQFSDIRKDVYTNDNVFAYAVKVRPTWKGEGIVPSDFYTTIYVGVDE